ncbi:MAG: hypothetical protein WB791_04045 [Waddliaceae bacterium]
MLTDNDTGLANQRCYDSSFYYGFHTSKTIGIEGVSATGANVGKFFGYIPVFGLYVGVKRYWRALEISRICPEDDLSVKLPKRRAYCEMSGVGWCLIPKDLWVTANRFSRPQPSVSIISRQVFQSRFLAFPCGSRYHDLESRIGHQAFPSKIRYQDLLQIRIANQSQH